MLCHWFESLNEYRGTQVRARLVVKRLDARTTRLWACPTEPRSCFYGSVIPFVPD